MRKKTLLKRLVEMEDRLAQKVIELRNNEDASYRLHRKDLSELRNLLTDKGLVAFQRADRTNKEAAMAQFVDRVETLCSRITIQEKRLDGFAPISRERGKKLVQLEETVASLTPDLFDWMKETRGRLDYLENRFNNLRDIVKSSPSEEEECDCEEPTPSLEDRMATLEGRFEHLRSEVSSASPGILRDKIAGLEEKVHGLSIRVTRCGEGLTSLQEKFSDSDSDWRVAEGLAKVHDISRRMVRCETHVASIRGLVDKLRGDVREHLHPTLVSPEQGLISVSSDEKYDYQKPNSGSGEASGE